MSQTLTGPGGARLDVRLLADECGPDQPERRVLSSPSRLAICLPGAAMIVTAAPSSQLTVHRIDGATLAAHPDSPAASEPD